MSKENREHHCPFLNRPDDPRCTQHFQLDDLQHAFGYCFDRYHACPVYAERHAERRAERFAAAATAAPRGQTDDRGDDAYVRRYDQEQQQRPQPHYHRSLLVQINLPASRSPQPLAA